MKLSWFGRLALALFASLALGLGMSACGGGTIAYMWVLGQQYNQIGAFKVDDYTGNLTQVEHSPFSSQGTTPVSIVVKAGGRFVYVLNQGSGGGPAGSGAGASLAYFSVGGDGTLSYQQSYTSQGYVPLWLQFDSTNGYLYELDKYSPGPIVNGKPTPNVDGNGAITVFSIDPTTGRLTLVLNTQSVPPNSPAPTYWEVGQNPLMMKSAGSCLYTVNSADQTLTPYSQGGGGQLVTVTTGKITTNASNITSINGNGSSFILTDAGSNTIQPWTISAGCGAAPQPVVANLPGTSNPVYSLIDTTGKYLYILNQSSTSTSPNQSFSSISGYLIQSGTSLQALTGAPYSVDAAPVCMVEDPTNKYMYVSAHNPGEITGKLFDPTTGELSQLSRGSTFPAVGLANCLAISGAVD